MHSFLVKEHLNTKCPKLGKTSLADRDTAVRNSSILENSRFGKVSGRCYGYCDNFRVLLDLPECTSCGWLI